MKPSEAMLKGFAGIEKQCFGPVAVFPNGNRLMVFDDAFEFAGQKPCAVCALGALSLGLYRELHSINDVDGKDALEFWQREFGKSLGADADDGMAIEDIAGILAAEGK